MVEKDIMKLLITLVVVCTTFLTSIDAALFQLQPKSLAEVQLDQSDGVAQLISNLLKTLLSAVRKSIKTGEPLKRKEIVPPLVNTFGNFIPLLNNEIDHDPHGVGALFVKTLKEFLTLFERASMGDATARRETFLLVMKFFGNILPFINMGDWSKIQDDHVRIPRIRLHGFSNKGRRNHPKDNVIQTLDWEQEIEDLPTTTNPYIESDNIVSKVAAFIDLPEEVLLKAQFWSHILGTLASRLLSKALDG